MLYRHCWADEDSVNKDLINKNAVDSTPSKAVCVGRNYIEHAKELNNPVPDEPLLFIKPTSAFAPLNTQIDLSEKKEPVHYECELVVLVGETLSNCDEIEAQEAICGIGLGLDLTLRQKQSQLKSKGHPWERAKAFDGSCLLSPFIPYSPAQELQDLSFKLMINGSPRQTGETSQMIFPIKTLLSEISGEFTLFPGDVVMTGTPAGVGVLNINDKLCFYLGDKLLAQAEVISGD